MIKLNKIKLIKVFTVFKFIIIKIGPMILSENINFKWFVFQIVLYCGHTKCYIMSGDNELIQI